MPTIEAIARGRDNNFNLIRIAAASAVIVSHAYPLTLGHGAIEPLYGLMHPLTLGGAAVQVFFALSGYLVAASADRHSLSEFALLRTGRLMPGLIVVAAITTTLLHFVSFANNPYVDTNGSLWTLWYEAICYAALAVWDRSRLLFVITAAAFIVVVDSGNLNYYFRFGVPFVLGVCVLRFKIPLRCWLALTFVGLAAIIQGELLWSLALGYGALWVGLAAPTLRSYNRLGDYSYGTYIFGWPVEQLIELFLPNVSPIAMMALALPITWSLGALSWHFVERPSLSIFRRFVAEKRERRCASDPVLAVQVALDVADLRAR